MREFFLDRVRIDPLLDGQNYIYMHYADMIANGYHRLAPCPFQTQGIMVNPTGACSSARTARWWGTCVDERSRGAIYFRRGQPGSTVSTVQEREVPDVLEPLPDERGSAIKQIVSLREASSSARLARSDGIGRPSNPHNRRDSRPRAPGGHGAQLATATRFGAVSFGGRSAIRCHP